MSKRIKRVFSSSQEVFHLWANQSQDNARQAGGSGRFGGYISSRAFFEGDSCYSYGHHYKVGQIVKIKGQTVALINRTGYSPTTGKHINEASSAASHLLQIDVDSSFDWKKGLLEMQANLINSLFDKFNKRHFWEGYEIFDKDYEQVNFKEFNKLCDALKMQHLKIWPDQDLLDLLQEHVKACILRQKELEKQKNTPEYIAKKEKRAAQKLALEEKKKLQEQEKQATEIEAWKKGGPFTYAVSQCRPQMIRIVNNEVQTSSRASVPLQDALNALRLILAGTIEAGHKIGAYTFDRFDKSKNTVTIGCHVIDLVNAQTVLTNAKHLKAV